MADVLKELVGIEEECAKAFNQREIETLLSYFSDDILGFSSTKHDRFSGKDELRQTFEYYLSEAEEVTYQITEPQATDLGDVAVLSFYWKVILKTGEKVNEIPGRGSHVFRRINGEWKIVHEHFSRAH